MAWTILTARATGDLITATNWNQGVVDNPAYLKGRAGAVEFEATLQSDTDVTDDLGTTAKLWRAIYARSIFGSRMRVNPNIREVRIPWGTLSNTADERQVTERVTGVGSSLDSGGTGQVVAKVDNDAGGVRAAGVEQKGEQVSSLNNAWTTTKKPYIRVEFSLNAEEASAEVFIGFRTTPGDSVPTTEHHVGLLWNGGANWTFSSGNGSGSGDNLTTDPTAGARNVVEIYLNGATDAELWLNGVRQVVKTTLLPTSAMEWQVLMGTDGLGGASDSILTIGQIVIQEEL